MENTLENKAKYFAQYWGQKVLSNVDTGRIFTPFIDVFALRTDCIAKTDLLNLKPLSSITYEDAIEVAKHQLYEPEKMYPLSIGFDVEDEFMVCLQTLRHDHYEVVNINAIDYLRSKGYALPWMGLSVGKLIEYGWLKLSS